ncbi:MAG: aldo/keto reductase [Bacteroidales bacterium]|nr:aldo/keto reductase [Bacteroidales bacterium]
MPESVLNKFSPVVAGTMSYGKGGKNLTEGEVADLIKHTVSNKITTFDMADIYGDYTTEALFGKGFRKSGVFRESVQFVTKCGIKAPQPTRPEYKVKHYDTSRDHITWSVENSLKNLHTDYLDLLLIHRPDPLMDPRELAEVFQKLKDDGKVLHFGVSNFTPTQFEMMDAQFPLVTDQVESKSEHAQAVFEHGTLDLCVEKNIRPMAWSPLGQGLLTGKSAASGLLREMATQHQATPAQVLIAWLLKHPSGILPVMGTTRPERLRKHGLRSRLSLRARSGLHCGKPLKEKKFPKQRALSL